MTTNRRTKHAARELARASGSSYAAARRALTQPSWPRAFDMDVEPSSTSWPFALDDESRLVRLNVSDAAPHLLIFGPAGSGKTVAARSLAYSALRSGCQVAIIDMTGGGSSYEFARRYTLGIATDLASAVEVMTAFSERITAVTDLVREHGAQRLSDLDESVRPGRPVIIIDGVQDAITSPYRSDDEETARRKSFMDKALTEIACHHGLSGIDTGTSMILVNQSGKIGSLSDLPGGRALTTRAQRLLLGERSSMSQLLALRNPYTVSMPDPQRKGSGLFETTSSSHPMPIDVTYADQTALAHDLARRMAAGIEVGASVQIVGTNKWWWKVAARDERYLVLIRSSMYAVIDLAWSTTYNGVTPGAAVSSLDTLGGGWDDLDHPETILAALRSGEHELSHRRVASVERLIVR